MISYILLGLGGLMVAIVAGVRTKLAPIIVALALAANLASVELAKGFPTHQSPPRQGIIWAQVGPYVVITPVKKGEPRLYALDLGPEMGALIGQYGPIIYDMDKMPGGKFPNAVKGKGDGTSANNGEMTPLDQNLEDKSEAP